MAYNTREEGRRISGEKSSRGGTGNPDKASPAAVERYIKGIHFPASKEDLLEQAHQNRAPQDVIGVLERFSDQEYHAIWDIARETGIVDRGERSRGREEDLDDEDDYNRSDYESEERSEEDRDRYDDSRRSSRGSHDDRSSRSSSSRGNGYREEREQYGSSGRVSPVEVERYLKGIRFPAHKEDLLEEARNNRAPQEAIRVINRFRDQDYHTVWEVAKETGLVERS